MADLRDQLLKAGLIDKKSKQQADTSDRKNRKQKKKKKKIQAANEERLRRQAYDDKMAAEAREHRRLAQAEALAREAQERNNRVMNLLDAWAERVVVPGPIRWCVLTREQRINWLYVTDEVAKRLELGTLAIVEHPGDAEAPYALVPRDIAARINELDPMIIRFWNHPS